MTVLVATWHWLRAHIWAALAFIGGVVVATVAGKRSRAVGAPGPLDTALAELRRKQDVATATYTVKVDAARSGNAAALKNLQDVLADSDPDRQLEALTALANEARARAGG